MFCGPALLYLGFSLIQIVIDLYKGLYNTTFIKFIVMVLFTIFLNILCKSGLTIISWFVVFIPFISMTVITTLLLFVFGLDPSVGNLNYDILNTGAMGGNIFTYNNTGRWIVTYADSTTDYITINNGLYILNGQSYQLLDTNPITINWYDGTIQTVDVINDDGSIRWVTTHSLPKYQYMVWTRQDDELGIGYRPNLYNQDNLDPCPPNMSPQEYNMYYGGYCATKNQIDNFDSNYTGNFRVTYYDGITYLVYHLDLIYYFLTYNQAYYLLIPI